MFLFFTNEPLKLIHILQKSALKLPKLWFVCKSCMFIYNFEKRTTSKTKKSSSWNDIRTWIDATPIMIFHGNVSSKKWPNEFDFTIMIPQVDLFLFFFWKKLKTTKRHFEINWPLAKEILPLDSALWVPQNYWHAIDSSSSSTYYNVVIA